MGRRAPFCFGSTQLDSIGDIREVSLRRTPKILKRCLYTSIHVYNPYLSVVLRHPDGEGIAFLVNCFFSKLLFLANAFPIFFTELLVYKYTCIQPVFRYPFLALCDEGELWLCKITTLLEGFSFGERLSVFNQTLACNSQRHKMKMREGDWIGFVVSDRYAHPISPSHLKTFQKYNFQHTL